MTAQRILLLAALALGACTETGSSPTPPDAFGPEGLAFPDGFPSEQPDQGVPTDLSPPTDGAAPQPSLLQGLTLMVNLGDSLAAGYYASSGHSYRALLVKNDDLLYPAYAKHDLKSLFPVIKIVDKSKSGSTTKDVAGQASSVAGNPVGNTLVLISAGGNDFNDKLQVMIDPVQTMAAAKAAVANLTKIKNHFANKTLYPGKVFIVMLNVHDPTDGVGTLPAISGLTGFCSTIRGPIGLLFGPIAIQNLGTFNKELATFAAASQEVSPVDNHQAFLGHGYHYQDKTKPHYDAGDPTLWFHNDCAHLNNLGHHHLRRLIWQALGGTTN